MVVEPFNQIGRARNTGAAAATGEWLMFVDADSHPSEELFGDVVDTIAAGKCLAGGSTVRLDERILTADFITGGLEPGKPLETAAGGSIYFCGSGGVPSDRGIRHGIFCGGRIDTWPSG